MPSWPLPQYSWQGIACSPGLRNVVVNVATNPGTSITLALVSATRKPCDHVRARAAERDRNAGGHEEARRVEGVLLGDEAHDDLAVGSHAGAEVGLDELALDVQRARVDRLDARGRHRGPVQPRHHHHRHQRGDDEADHDRPAPLGGDRDGFDRHCTAPRGRYTRK